MRETASSRPASAPARAEARLVARAARGDAHAFATLIQGYDRPLRALAYRLLEDESAMDDVLQEAFVKAYTSLPAFQGASTFGTWLYRIVYNRCLDEIRRRSRRPTLAPVEDFERVHSEKAGSVENVVIAADLGRALAALPVELRAAVLLVDAEGYPYDEASAILGVPRGTLASRLNRARALLRPALEGLTTGADPA